MRILSEGVAQLPWEQFRDAGDTQVKMPLGQLLSKPSAFVNKFDWKYQYVSSAALDGTAFGLIAGRDGYGYPTTVEWLPPDRMDVIDSEPFNPALARFFYNGHPVPREDLLLVRAFTIPGRTRGVSVIKHFQLLIESGIDTLAYGADWYKSGGIPPGVFKNDQYEVEDEQSEKIRAKLVQAQRRRVPLVVGRDWTYTPINVPPDEAQFINAMQMNATQVAGLFGVPPHKVGGAVSTGDIRYANVESEQIGFIQDTLDPWLVRLEEALAEYLPSQQYVQFNRDARLRMTPETRFAVYRAARDIGVWNVDEIRKKEGDKPLPKPKDADDYDGSDWTPLQIQVAAARGVKQIIGEGAGDEETNPQNAAKPAPGQVPGQAPGPGKPAPVPAMNGNGNGSRPGGR